VSLRELAHREALGGELAAVRDEREAAVAFLLTIADGLSYEDRVRLTRIAARIRNNEHRKTKC
jgi:hypothetical protein